eukprot:PhF_6_TR10803/c0_g1_i1/m.17391/K12479/VPS45; vacuolar protein sorting-associated protein 45
MNISVPVKGYVTQMCSDVVGLKVLLLDDETSGIVSMVYTQSEIIAKEVYLVEGISKFDDRQEMPHLKCVVFLRPTEENITLLCRELRRPNYGEYHLYFTNIISRDHLQRLAESDEREVVRKCEEYFGDVYVVNPDTYTVRTHPTAIGERVSQGLFSSLLALKRRPTTIRYQRNSGACQSLATSLQSTITKTLAVESEFQIPKHGACTVLIVDRWEDPVTPLLLPWTYQAMLHEYFGIDRNRVVLDKSEEAKKEKKIEENEFVFQASQDQFFAKNQYANWGELCASVKELVDAFQATISQKEAVKQTGSLQDMKTLLQNLPQHRLLGSAVSKHVSIVTQVGEVLRGRGLFNIGVLEQDIACNNSHNEHWRELVELINTSGRTTPNDVLRVAMVYFLRYEKNPSCNYARLKELLNTNGVPTDALERLRDRCGADKRQSTPILFPNETNLLKIVMNSVKGMDSEKSVYTQHEPMLKRLSQHCAKGTLPADLYPVVAGNATEKCKEVIVFIVGGATYTEAAYVNLMNAQADAIAGGQKPKTVGDVEVRVVLGTTEMINIETFLKLL